MVIRKSLVLRLPPTEIFMHKVQKTLFLLHFAILDLTNFHCKIMTTKPFKNYLGTFLYSGFYTFELLILKICFIHELLHIDHLFESQRQLLGLTSLVFGDSPRPNNAVLSTSVFTMP